MLAISFSGAMLLGGASAVGADDPRTVDPPPVTGHAQVVATWLLDLGDAPYWWNLVDYQIDPAGTQLPADDPRFLIGRGDRSVVRISDGESGLSARTIARRLSTVSGLYAYLIARGDTGLEVNPVPRGLSTRRRGGRRQQVPLVRVPRTLPKILRPEEVRALLGALRTDRDRAMVHAMVLGGLRRCEVLGLRLADIRVADRSLVIADGKGGHQRVVPVSNTFFASVGDYLRNERLATGTDRVFVTMKGPRRGEPMTASGVDKILQAARQRVRLRHITCHELRHTCLTRLREAGMALEAVQAQAGHRSIESTRIYLHLTDAWLAEEYRKAAVLIDADHAELASQEPRS